MKYCVIFGQKVCQAVGASVLVIDKMNDALELFSLEIRT